MATSSIRQTVMTFQGDINQNVTLVASTNTNSQGANYLSSLVVGNNTIIPPTASSVMPIFSVTIIPPATNTTLLILKGVNGDTGIPIHKTNPTTIALDTTFTNFVINNSGGSTITGVRFIWE